MSHLRLIFTAIFLLSFSLSSEAIIKINKPEVTDASIECHDCAGSEEFSEAEGEGEVILAAAKKSKGKLFPLPKCRGLRNDKYGSGKYGAKRRGYAHTGVDWKASIGTPLKSPAAGKVTVASYNKKAGYMIKITHTDGSKTVYMHLAKGLKVKSGQKVKAGQIIGATSNSGNARGTVPHLHFEYYDSKGRRQNPSKVFGC